MQTRQVNVHRWSITSSNLLTLLWRRWKKRVGRPNMSEFAANMNAATSHEQMEKVVHDSISEIGLMEFMRLDHGAVLAKAGVDGNPRSVRLIMGNPLIMQSMA